MRTLLNKFILLLVYRLIGPTIRIMNNPMSDIKAIKKQGRSVLFVLWHDMTAVCIYFYRYQNAGVFIEASEKGDILAATAHHFGYPDMRVTDNPGDRQSIKGALQLIKHMRSGYDGIIAADGPNGPYHIPKPGAFNIAEKTNAIIIPVGV